MALKGTALFVCSQLKGRAGPDCYVSAGGWLVGVDFMLTAEELEQLLEVNCSRKTSEDDDDQEEPCQS